MASPALVGFAANTGEATKLGTTIADPNKDRRQINHSAPVFDSHRLKVVMANNRQAHDAMMSRNKRCEPLMVPWLPTWPDLMPIDDGFG